MSSAAVGFVLVLWQSPLARPLFVFFSAAATPGSMRFLGAL